MNILLFDIAAPSGGTVAIGAGVAWLILLAILAITIFIIFRKMMKLAFRVAIVGMLAFIALAGFIAIFWLF